MRTALKLFCLSLLFINQSTVFSTSLDLTDLDARDRFIKHGYTPNTAMGDLSDQVVSPLTNTPLSPSFDIVNGTKHGFSNRVANENERLYIVSHLKMLALRKGSSDVWSDLWDSSKTYTPQQQEHLLNAYTIISLYQKLNASHLLAQGSLSEQTYNEHVQTYADQAIDATRKLMGTTGLSDANIFNRVHGFMSRYVLPTNQYLSSSLTHCATLEDFYASLQPSFIAPPSPPVRSMDKEALQDIVLSLELQYQPIAQEWINLLSEESILSLPHGANTYTLVNRLEIINAIAPELLVKLANHYQDFATLKSSPADKLRALSDYSKSRMFQQTFNKQFKLYVNTKGFPAEEKAALSKWVDLILSTPDDHRSKGDLEEFLGLLIKTDEPTVTALHGMYLNILTKLGKTCVMQLTGQEERRKVIHDLYTEASA